MMFNNFKFGLVDDVTVSMFGIAIANKDGNLVSYDTEKKEVVNVEGFTFETANMIYSMPCKTSKIVPGDVIIHNGNYVFVEMVNNGVLKVIDPYEGTRKEILPTKTMFGFDFVTKIVNLIDFSKFFKDDNEEENSFSKMLPFMLMNNGNMNNLLPLLLMKDSNSDNKDLLLMMMLSQNGNGGSEGNNFFQMMMLKNLM